MNFQNTIGKRYLFPPGSTIEPILEGRSCKIRIGEMVFLFLGACTIPQLQNSFDVYTLSPNQYSEVVNRHYPSLSRLISHVYHKLLAEMGVVFRVAEAENLFHVINFLFTQTLRAHMLCLLDVHRRWSSNPVSQCFDSFPLGQINLTLKIDRVINGRFVYSDKEQSC